MELDTMARSARTTARRRRGIEGALRTGAPRIPRSAQAPPTRAREPATGVLHRRDALHFVANSSLRFWITSRSAAFSELQVRSSIVRNHAISSALAGQPTLPV